MNRAAVLVAVAVFESNAATATRDLRGVSGEGGGGGGRVAFCVLIVVACSIFVQASPRASDLIPYRAEGWSFLEVAHGDPIIAEFFQSRFEDSSWPKGRGAFGSGGNCALQGTASTAWQVGTDILLRRRFDANPYYPVAVYVAVDNDARVYLNGVLLSEILSANCPSLDQHVVAVPASFVLPEDNVLAVWGHDYGGESFIDVRVEGVPPLANAPTCQFLDFTMPEGVQLVGDAVLDNARVRLTPAQFLKRGALWLSEKSLVSSGFAVRFRFSITPAHTAGADGIAFVVQNDTANALGTAGHGIGYHGIRNSIAVEFDTYHNGGADPNGNHIAVHSLGRLPNHSTSLDASLGSTSDVPILEDGAIHEAVVRYRPGELSVGIDGYKRVLVVSTNLDSLLNLDSGRAWIGFTSATANAWSNHYVHSLECSGETITSSDPAHAYPIVGALQDQIAQINGGPPPYPNGWQPVVRQADNHARTTHVCYESLGITGADPAVEFTVPPSDLRLGKWESSTSIRVFNEQIRTAVSTLVPVNQSFRGCGTEEVELSDFTEALGAVPPGTAVNSHLLHFDPLGQANVTMTGRVYFDSPIVGVIGSPLLLDQTDALFGHPGVEHYATGQADRGPENGPVDYVTVGADRRSLFVHLVAENKMDEIRVLTAGSADPIQQPYVDVDSYMVNIDEVSLDNCSSAFYRFEFELPDNFNAPSLVGQANADDVAVVYLNGTRISPALLNSDTWGVDRNEGGMALISAPTLDSFTASASSLFLPGTNELAFGILGDACDSDPTGLEFSAQVNYGLPASSAVSVTSAAPAHIGLSLPSPNPGRAFGFALGLSVREHVAIRVHDALGRVVDVVARDQLDPGVHEFEWRPHASMANGVYFIEAQGSGGAKSVRRLLLLR